MHPRENPGYAYEFARPWKKNPAGAHVGETGRSFGDHIKKHQKEVELHEKRKYTRSSRKQLQSEQNKSAITDHTENHITDGQDETIIGRESDRSTRWIREAVKI